MATPSHTRVVAHRGLPRLLPENCLTGFVDAAALGVDALELDLHLSSDGIPVLMHDPWLTRMTGDERHVSDLTATQLSRTMLKGSPEGVPTLDAVLEALCGKTPDIDIEIKRDARGRAYDGIAEKVIERVAAYGMVARCTLTSFYPEDLAHFRRIEKSIRLLASVNLASASCFGGFEALIASIQAIDRDCRIAVEKSLLRHNYQAFLALVPADRLGVWVVNDGAELEFWFNENIGFLTTDLADVALAARKNLMRRSMV